MGEVQVGIFHGGSLVEVGPEECNLWAAFFPARTVSREATS
jgi:hypothetical protein